MEFTINSVSSGLNVVPNQTYVYLSARNIGNDEPINSATFTLISQHATSTASLEKLDDPTWAQFKPDIFKAFATTNDVTESSKLKFNTKFFGADPSSEI